MNSLISVQEVTRNFKTNGETLRVLKGINLEVSSSEILAILGASGAGKSTLIHIMGTLDRPTSGQVMFQGRDLLRLNERALRRVRNQELAFVFQFFHLLPGFTALENVMIPGLLHNFSRGKCRERANELLERVGLGERMNHRPVQLSAGEQQRVAVARALFNRPSVLYADEPTGNLDSESSEEVCKLLWELRDTEDTALILVTHNQEIAARADRIVHIIDGKIVHAGEAEKNLPQNR